MDKQLKNKIKPDVQYKVLSVLHQNPSLSQRELAKKLKISLGGINYCLKSLVDVGHIKITNFNNFNKLIYRRDGVYFPTA